MKIYRIGTTYVDLDHVAAIGEPYLGSVGCMTCVNIPVVMLFIGSHKIELAIEAYKTEWPKNLLTAEQRDAFLRERDIKQTEHEVAELMRLKYNIWKPFLEAWENKDKGDAPES